MKRASDRPEAPAEYTTRAALGQWPGSCTEYSAHGHLGRRLDPPPRKVRDARQPDPPLRPARVAPRPASSRSLASAGYHDGRGRHARRRGGRAARLSATTSSSPRDWPFPGRSAGIRSASPDAHARARRRPRRRRGGAHRLPGGRRGRRHRRGLRPDRELEARIEALLIRAGRLRPGGTAPDIPPARSSPSSPRRAASGPRPWRSTRAVLAGAAAHAGAAGPSAAARVLLRRPRPPVRPGGDAPQPVATLRLRRPCRRRAGAHRPGAGR